MRATTLKLAIRNLLLHKLRSALTMLGTILGVSSVISMLAIGEGSKREAVEQIRRLGATNVIVRSIKPPDDRPQMDNDSSGTETSSSDSESIWVLEYGLTYRDLELLEATLPTVDSAVPIALVRKDAQHGSRRIPNARILGVPPAYRELMNLTLRRGRFLKAPDERDMANVAVLGAGAAERLFAYSDPLHKTVHLGSGAYRVIGVLDPQDSGKARPGASGSDDQNEDIYVPLAATRARFGDVQVIRRAGLTEYRRNELHEITLRTREEALVSQTAAMARKLLLRNHPRADDFEIQVPLELLDQAKREKRLWNLVLGSIAGISLIVGGIGIMNIMLATITERTREIGIRRALGAKRRDITLQFLVETTVLSATGGTIGVFLGMAIPLGVDNVLGIEAALSWWAIFLAFGMSVGVGGAFGIYPARRAALMDPIEALRHQ